MKPLRWAAEHRPAARRAFVRGYMRGHQDGLEHARDAVLRAVTAGADDDDTAEFARHALGAIDRLEVPP